MSLHDCSLAKHCIPPQARDFPRRSKRSARRNSSTLMEEVWIFWISAGTMDRLVVRLFTSLSDTV